MRHARRETRGFTLLEVMVALVVVSIGLLAVFNGVSQMAHSTGKMRDRALADWIAMNQITEIRLAGEFPEVGEFNDTVEFAGGEWRWSARVSETGVENLRRIDLSVARDERRDDVVTVVTGFVSRGVAAPPMRIDWWGTGQVPAGPGEQDPGEQPNPQSGGEELTPQNPGEQEEDED